MSYAAGDDRSKEDRYFMGGAPRADWSRRALVPQTLYAALVFPAVKWDNRDYPTEIKSDYACEEFSTGLAEQFLGSVSEQLLMSTSFSPLLLKDTIEDKARVQLMCFCFCDRRYSEMVTHAQAFDN